ncbi:MAG TPA: DUF2934 domain-containing protein [Vicinamibacterales bacterium]|nr:DUF2934 domain-containing protein [Vicinamibacterales bacterium]
MEPPNPRSKVDRFAMQTGGTPAEPPGIHIVRTRDRAVIRQWATSNGAEPATGEATASGPAGRKVNDSGAGIRFNFPGFAPFRPIGWDEWFEHFDRHELVFVFEEEDRARVAARAHERWQARGGEDGDDKRDWFEAESDLQPGDGRMTPVRYRLVKGAGEERS